MMRLLHPQLKEQYTKHISDSSSTVCGSLLCFDNCGMKQFCSYHTPRERQVIELNCRKEHEKIKQSQQIKIQRLKPPACYSFINCAP